MHWLEVEQNKEQYLNYLRHRDSQLAEMSRLAHIIRVEFAFTLIALYELYPDLMEEIDTHWMYFRGYLVQGL